jgi:hypothetical protein
VEQKLGNHISCLFTVQAVHDNHAEKMDNPSNGVSIVGYLRPAFIEEESYLRSLFRGGCNSDGSSSDWKGNPLADLDMQNLLFSQSLFFNLVFSHNDSSKLTDEDNRYARAVLGANLLIGNLIS